MTTSKLSLVSNADLRRDQLLQIAKDIILDEGIESLRHATVAKRAGVTRAVIYRYFPKQSDFFVAITGEFTQAIDQAMSKVEQDQAVASSVTDNLDAAMRLFEVIFDINERLGLASSVLMAVPEISPELSDCLADQYQEFYRPWVGRVMAVGLSEVDAHLVAQIGRTTTTEMYKAYRAGDLSKKQAVSRVNTTICSLVNTYLENP